MLEHHIPHPIHELLEESSCFYMSLSNIRDKIRYRLYISITHSVYTPIDE